MKTLKFLGKSEVEIIETSIPEPMFGQVRIKTVVSALCGSELSKYKGPGCTHGNDGHEAAGIVNKIGEGVSQDLLGKRVGISAISGCGKCEYCAKGQFTWCPSFSFYGSMHAEYFVVPAMACHPIPDEISWQAGVLLSGDGFGVPYHSNTKMEGYNIQSVAIFGMGAVGLGNLIMQHYNGRKVIAIDISETRLALAKEWGAVATINPSKIPDVPAAIKALTEGKGADVCIEAAGRPETAKNCFKAVKTNGLVVFNGEQVAVELSPSDDFIRRDIRAVGAWYYHFNEYPAMLEMYRKGLPVTQLITHTFPLDMASEAYKAMAGGMSGKVILQYT